MAPPAGSSAPRTLFDKVWSAHAIVEREDGSTLLHVDRHLIHDVAGVIIGELAERTGASRRSLRHYEEAGLLRADRAANGYRSYPEIAIQLVGQIRRFLALGFTLDEIRSFPHCMQAAQTTGLCSEVVAAHRHKLDEIDRQLEELEERRSRLLLSLQSP